MNSHSTGVDCVHCCTGEMMSTMSVGMRTTARGGTVRAITILTRHSFGVSLNRSLHSRYNCAQNVHIFVHIEVYVALILKIVYIVSTKCLLCIYPQNVPYYLSHCYTIAWDRLSNQFFCLCMCICMYVCVCVCLWARLRPHFSTDLHEIW